MVHLEQMMDNEILRAFRKDSRTMVRELGFLQEAWAPAGIAHAQVHLLLELAEAGVLRPGDLAERLRSDPAVISRSVRALSDKGLLRSSPNPADGRQRNLSLTDAGRAVVSGVHADADSQVRGALAVLDPGSRERVVEGMRVYAKALRRSRLQQDITLRPIRASDDASVTALIRTVMPEFGASGPGYAIGDPEVDAMFEAYSAPRSTYWVVTRGGMVLGGAGYAPLVGGEPGTCELRKMYFRRELRGLGVGAKLLETVLEAATAEGFVYCYLETLARMVQALRLYESFGFEVLPGPLGNTGHNSCDAWYALNLRERHAQPIL